jgi:hypothetical protein
MGVFQFGGNQSMLSSSKRAALTQDAPQAPFDELTLCVPTPLRLPQN